jgi:hypothetical protein
MDGKSICRWAIAGCLIAGAAGCGALHQRSAGGGNYSPYGEDQAAAECNAEPPPYPHLPSLYPVPTHPVFLPLQPDGLAALSPGLNPATKSGAAPVIEGPQIQIVPPTAEEAPAPSHVKQTDRVTQNAPRPAADPDAPSWLFPADGLAAANANGLASRKSDKDGEQIRR